MIRAPTSLASAVPGSPPNPSNSNHQHTSHTFVLLNRANSYPIWLLTITNTGCPRLEFISNTQIPTGSRILLSFARLQR
jgi:hypothetical protein